MTAPGRKGCQPRYLWGKPNPEWEGPTPASSHQTVGGSTSEVRGDSVSDEPKPVVAPTTLEEKRIVDIASSFKNYLNMNLGVYHEKFINDMDEDEREEAIEDFISQLSSQPSRAGGYFMMDDFLSEKIMEEVANDERQAPGAQEFSELVHGYGDHKAEHWELRKKYQEDYHKERDDLRKLNSDEDHIYDELIKELETNGFAREVFSTKSNIEHFRNSLKRDDLDEDIDYEKYYPTASFSPYPEYNDSGMQSSYMFRLQDGEEIDGGYEHYFSSDIGGDDAREIVNQNLEDIKSMTQEWLASSDSDDDSGYLLIEGKYMGWRNLRGIKVMSVDDFLKDPSHAIAPSTMEFHQDWKQSKDGTLRAVQSHHDAQAEKYTITRISQKDFDDKYEDYIY